MSYIGILGKHQDKIVRTCQLYVSCTWGKITQWEQSMNICLCYQLLSGSRVTAQSRVSVISVMLATICKHFIGILGGKNFIYQIQGNNKIFVFSVIVCVGVVFFINTFFSRWRWKQSNTNLHELLLFISLFSWNETLNIKVPIGILLLKIKNSKYKTKIFGKILFSLSRRGLPCSSQDNPPFPPSASDCRTRNTWNNQSSWKSSWAGRSQETTDCPCYSWSRVE